MPFSNVLAYIEASKAPQNLSVLINEVEQAGEYGCSLREGASYTLIHHSRREPVEIDIAGYLLLESSYILQDDQGGMFVVLLVECQATHKLGIVLAQQLTPKFNPFSRLLAVASR